MLQNKQAKGKEKKEEKRKERGKGESGTGRANRPGRGRHQVTAEGIASSPMRARPRAAAFRPRLRAAESCASYLLSGSVHVRPDLARSGRIWPHLAIPGHTWPVVDRPVTPWWALLYLANARPLRVFASQSC